MLDWLNLWWPLIDREWDGIAKHEGTQSQALAEGFRVSTTAGKFAFTGALAAGSFLLWVHIVRWEFKAKAVRP